MTKELKLSEARIISYLAQAEEHSRYGLKIAAALDMDYHYTLEILSIMIEKKLVKHSFGEGNNKKHYRLAYKADVEQARERIEELEGRDPFKRKKKNVMQLLLM